MEPNSMQHSENMGVREILDQLTRLSVADLRVVHNAVRTRLRHLEEVQNRVDLQQYAPGDRVAFEHRGRTIIGIVERVNIKTVSITTQEGGWRVAPRYLHRCRDVGSSQEYERGE